MPISPLARQCIVAGSAHLAALSAGGMIAYPGVLLQQLQANDTIIQLDLDNGSWIGSVHGIAGIPSIFLPFLMQYKGRKFAFLLSCILMITGWLLIYLAQDIKTLIIGECFHGIGGNSLFAASSLSISEMVHPKYRNPFLLLYGTVQSLGISSVGILGRFLYWKTISLILCIPILVALFIGCLWPESPSWLACKGKFEECEKIFGRLRGTDEDSRKELIAIIRTSQKENIREKTQGAQLKRFFETVTSRDFYLPALHTIVLINVIYWGGGMPVIIYGSDMILKSSGKTYPLAKLIMDIALFVGYNVTTILVRYCSSKKVLLFSMCTSSASMTLAAVTSYLQAVGVLSSDSKLAVYSLVGFVIFFSLGSCSIGYVIAAEIMPVKHRGIGGCVYLICVCMFHSVSLKTYPYLCLYVKIWGVFTIYALYIMFSILFIWKFVPETKNMTLNEIEMCYKQGYLAKSIVNDSVNVPFVKTEKTLKEIELE